MAKNIPEMMRHQSTDLRSQIHPHQKKFHIIVKQHNTKDKEMVLKEAGTVGGIFQ